MKEIRRRDKLKLKISETMDLQSMGTIESRVGTGTTSNTINEKPVSQGLSQKEDDDWNRRRYQREDEILWGHEEGTESETSRGFSPITRTSSGGSHYYARNPEVNDLHPPVVSAYSSSPIDTQWMLQPPPRAKVMEGKQRANRSRSGSGTSGGTSMASRGSSRRGKCDNLGRTIGERILEEKMARGEGPPLSLSATNLSMSRGGSNISFASSSSRSTTLPGQQQGKERSIKTTSKDSLYSSSQMAGTRNSTLMDSVERTDMADFVPTRPHLSTIHSMSSQLRQAQEPRGAPAKSSRPSLSVTRSTSSLETLQKVRPLSDISNNRNNQVLEDARSVKLPATPREDKDDGMLRVHEWEPSVNTATGWSFPLPTMELATGHRWSMDI